MENQQSLKQINHSEPTFFEKESMFTYDVDTLRIIDANSVALEQYGFTKKEIIKKKITSLGKRVQLSEIQLKSFEKVDGKPRELWWHQNKEGKKWMVQLTTQEFRYNNKTVKMAVAHKIENLIENNQLNVERLPRIDLVLTHTPFGIVEWSSGLEVRDFSKKSELIFETDYEDVIGLSAETLPFIEDSFIHDFRCEMEQAAKERAPYFLVESLSYDSMENEVYCIWHNTIIQDKQGRIINIYSLIEDVTDQKKFNQKLKKSEKKFRVMSEQSFVGIYILKNSSFQYVNPRLCEITGYSEQELLSDIGIWDLVHPVDLDRVKNEHKEWKKNPTESVEYSLKILSKSGQTLHVKTYGSAIENNGEQALLGVVVDQTSQLKALESYQSLFDSISDGIYIKDEKGRFLEVNKEFEKMYGYEKGEVLGKKFTFLAAQDMVNMEDTLLRFNKALEGDTQLFRWWGKRKNGEVFPKEIKLSKGSFFGKDVVIAVARDITENVNYEEELRRNEQLFEQLFRNSPLGIALLDKDSKIQQVNNSFEMMFGYQQSEIVGTNLDDLVVPEKDLEEAQTLSESKKPFTLTKKRRVKSGELIDVFIYGVPVVVEGETIAIYGIYMDITDRIQAENRVKQSLKEKEVLLSEIHHRVKNNLAVITGLLELQFHNLKSEEAKNALRDSQMRINSMALIHEKLYQSESLSNIDFGVYIKELVQVIVKSHEREGLNVGVEMESDPIELPIIKAIPCGLIINEIVTNSMKYAFKQDHENPLISITLTTENGRATIQISDNGIGLPKPFAEIGKGSLGTLLIKTLIKQLEADLKVVGEGGTKYSFSFNLMN